MKKIKISIVSLGITLIAFNLSNPTAVEAQEVTISATGETKKISINRCTNKSGKFTGWGNTCKEGSGSCVANPCTQDQTETF